MEGVGCYGRTDDRNKIGLSKTFGTEPVPRSGGTGGQVLRKRYYNTVCGCQNKEITKVHA